MNKKDIENMLHGIDDQFLEEAQTTIPRRNLSSWQRMAAVIAILFLCGFGFSFAVYASITLKTILEDIFQGKVHSQMINYDTDMMVAGVNESFIYTYHMENDQEVVDQVYTVTNNELKEIERKSFSGFYDEEEFSFEYSTLHDEIFAYNFKGSIGEVFFLYKNDKTYASLEQVQNDTVKKACLVELDLKNGDIRKLSDDDMKCNFRMSPEGNSILCNHRSAGYWSVFDLTKQRERTIDTELISDCLIDEICFKDEDHILVPGDTYMIDNVEYTGENLINLNNMCVEESYKKFGEIELRWNYDISNEALTITDVTDDSTFSMKGVTGGYYLAEAQGNYALFMDGNESCPSYLVDMKQKKYKAITLPIELNNALNMHLMNNQKNMLFYSDGTAYVVDLAEF